MASSATVGSAVIKLSFDGKGVKAELNGVSQQIESTGSSSGSAFGNAWTVAAGTIIAKGVTKIAQTISNQLGDAVIRADTLTRFPKVMEQMGYSADAAEVAIQKLVKGVEKVPTPLDKVVSGTQQLVAVTRDVDKASDWMLAVSDAMLSNSASAEKAQLAVYQFTQILQKGKPVGDDWRAVMEAAPGVMLELAEAMGYTSAVMGGDFYTALQKGEVSIEDMMDVLVKMDKEGLNGFDSLQKRAETASGGIETSMTILKQSISNAIRDIILDIGPDKIKEGINSIKEALVGLVKGIGEVVKFVVNNWSILEPIFTGVLSFIGALGAFFVAKKITTGLTALFALIQAQPLTLVLGAIIFTITELIMHFDEVKSTVEAVFSAIGEIIGNFGTWIGETFTGIWDTVTNLFGGLADFFGSVFGGAWEAVKNVFSTGGKIFMGIVDGITQAFRTIVNAIITGINHVVAIPFNAINGFLSFLKSIDILGIKPFDWVGTIDVPQIPLLAEGGVAGGATQAIIGEAGTEVVLPLENNTDNWAGLLASTLMEQMEAESIGGREIVVNMTNEINNQLDAEEIGRVMIQSIRRAA